MRVFFDQRQDAHAPARELHNGEWMPYSEKPSRTRSILDRLGSPAAVSDHGLAPVLAVHERAYVGFLQSAHARWLAAGRAGDAIGYTFPVVGRRPLPLDRIDAQLGAFSYDAGTPVAAGTWEGAYWSAQTALSALDAVAGGDRQAFALCRPPGHHAGRDYMGGYCYLNNAAIAARAARPLGYERVAILDVDYHHGNGTQDIFLDDGETFFCSIHADPATDYPFYWGHADETGTGDGDGATLNLPLPRGTAGETYLAVLDGAMEAIARHRPELLVVSFGADTHASDPICAFDLDRDDFRAMAQRIAGAAVPVLIVMEGGYAIGDLGLNVSAFLSGFSA